MRKKSDDIVDNWKLIATKNSTFDYWSVVHFCFYTFIASTVEAIFKFVPNYIYIHIIWVLSATIVWEVFELFAEDKWPEKWSNKKEHWSNRMIGDPISNILGAIFGIFVVWQ